MTLNITFLKRVYFNMFIKLFIEYKYNYFVFYYYESEGYKINFSNNVCLYIRMDNFYWIILYFAYKKENIYL